MRERAERLHGFCLRLERRRERGATLYEAQKQFAWFWKDRAYRTAPRVKAHFHQGTLTRLYYYWRENGRRPECFTLHYIDRLPPVSPDLVRRFTAACATSGITRLSQAARLVETGNIRFNRILSAMPERLRRKIKEAFRARRVAETEARRAVKLMQNGMRERLSADATRARHLNKLAEAIG